MIRNSLWVRSDQRSQLLWLGHPFSPIGLESTYALFPYQQKPWRLKYLFRMSLSSSMFTDLDSCWTSMIARGLSVKMPGLSFNVGQVDSSILGTWRMVSLSQALLMASCHSIKWFVFIQTLLFSAAPLVCLLIIILAVLT